MAPPTHQVGAAVADLAALCASIAAATLSTISPVGWVCDDACRKSPKQVYPMCHLLQTKTPPRVGKAIAWNIPRVFYLIRIQRRWMGRVLVMTSL